MGREESKELGMLKCGEVLFGGDEGEKNICSFGRRNTPRDAEDQRLESGKQEPDQTMK